MAGIGNHGGFMRYLPYYRYGFLRSLSFKASYISSLVTAMLQLAITVSIWRALYEGRSGFHYSYDAIIAYSFCSAFVWFGVNSRTARDIEMAVKNGGIDVVLVRPVNTFLAFLAQGIGRAAFGILFIATPVVTLFALSGNVVFDYSLLATGLLILSLALSIIMWVTIDVCIGMCALWTTSIFGADLIKESILRLTSGMAVPLSLYPDTLRGVLELLPPALMFFHPLNVFVSRAAASAQIYVIGEQAIWTTLLLAAGLAISERLRAKVNQAGG